ncbi:MAG TPA: Na+/H+ antiporter NhaA [Nitrospiraceae bacterium]|nr:Na+/H+ antiporter NhaA [Nitrospiraceae bacterium]
MPRNNWLQQRSRDVPESQKTETQREGEVLRHGPSLPVLRALDEVHDRLESPADVLLRHAGARSSYFVLPVFALANAGVAITTEVWSGHQAVLFAIMAGLVIGKPIGLMSASALAVWIGLGVKPEAYSGVNSAMPVYWPVVGLPCHCSSLAKHSRHQPTLLLQGRGVLRIRAKQVNPHGDEGQRPSLAAGARACRAS